MAKKITREEEGKLPSFDNHRDAINWFKYKYIHDFRWFGTDTVGDEICHFCAIILDRKAFETGRGMLLQGNAVAGTDYLNSFQVIEIFQSGRIHIVH